MAREVFISYSQPDHQCAMEMVARIEEQGIECWIAPRDIAPSADWAAEIIEAISNARTMILVFSASSNNSPQVRREVERAVHKQVSILPFRIEDVLPSKSLEYFLSAQHWLDAFPPPREPHYARLCSYLKMLLAAPGAPATLSSAPSGAPAVMQSSSHSGTHPVLVPSNSVNFDPSMISHIERHLAGYIGPLAKHLVRTAASRAAGLEDLIARLAAELDAESDRQQFTQRCRSGR
jgi:hypothetical protein